MTVRECPFCGSPRLEVVPALCMDKLVKRIRCMACGAEGPVNFCSETDHKAVQNWNRRSEFRTYMELP